MTRKVFMLALAGAPVAVAGREQQARDEAEYQISQFSPAEQATFRLGGERERGNLRKGRG